MDKLPKTNAINMDKLPNLNWSNFFLPSTATVVKSARFGIGSPTKLREAFSSRSFGGKTKSSLFGRKKGLLLYIFIDYSMFYLGWWKGLGFYDRMMILWCCFCKFGCESSESILILIRKRNGDLYADDVTEKPFVNMDMKITLDS